MPREWLNHAKSRVLATITDLGARCRSEKMSSVL